MFPVRDIVERRTFPFVNIALIVINIAIFLWSLSDFEYIVLTYGFTPIDWTPLTVFSSMFLHADPAHLIGNMWYLFIFGDNVEDRFGHLKYLLLYFLFGAAGGFTHSAITVAAGGPDQYIPAVGASGAIAGVLGAYLVFFPSARIVSLVPSIFIVQLARVPAFIFIGFWFILQILYSGGSSSVAYLAHVGGFLAGMAVAAVFKALSREREARWQ